MGAQARRDRPSRPSSGPRFRADGRRLHGISELERNAFLARLRALGTAHEVLTQEGWNRAPVRNAIDRALQPFASDRITMRGPYAPLDASRSLMLTMALHELATNAGKYGALSNGSGQVSIEWTVIDTGGERNIQLSWQPAGPASGA